MDSDRDQLVKEIFADALEKANAAERTTYLSQACGEDAQLRQHVEALLQAHQNAGAFLEEPAPPPPGLKIVLASPLTEKPGDKIGHYKLLEQIGEGGCGVVYMAEQEEPIRRRVAFKVIKLGMDTKQVIARFEAERQALALMDHLNIAKVLDAGATDTGRPYFVMELVRGLKITEYCDQNNLSTEERLNLFVQICHAIQHAHQKGIIHRDIKPSNILVTLHDGVPVPKVIDFGIAKATGQRLTDKTLFTAFQQFVGTPAYMSPEQAEMSGLDVDTRSDIYALGVLLYELLTGQTPFEQKALVAAGLDEMRRIIREQEAVRPSTRLSTLADPERTTVAKRYGVYPPQLIHLLRGDLDWIVMKSLEKDRTRRYQTANDLANDVLRHLNNEPVAARPPDRLYRLQKMIRRNKVQFVAGVAITAALVLGLGASTWMLFRERAAKAEQVRLRQRAEANEKRALAEATKREQVTQFLRSTLDTVGGSVAQGNWKAAVAEATEILELEPTNHWHYHTLAPLLLVSGDFEGYRKHCGRILTRFGTTRDPVIAERMVKDCLVLPWSGAGVQTVEQMAETAVTEWRGEDSLPFSQFAKALAEYRVGRFDSAAEWAQRCLAAHGVPFRDAQAWTVLGMAQSRLKRTQEARAALASGFEIAKGVGIGAKALPPLDHDWKDWIILDFLLREAKSLVEGELVTTNALGSQGSGPKESQSAVINRGRALAQGQSASLPMPAPQSEPQSASLLEGRADSSARRGEWNEAAAGAARAKGLEPSNHVPYHMLAPLLVASGNSEGYRHLCQEILARFSGTTNPFVADRMAKDCLILPSSGVDLEALGQLAETAVTVGKAQSALPYFQCTKALAEYRQGHFSSTVEWARKSIENHSFPADASRFVEAYVVLAMGHFQLKQTNEAREALHKAVEIEETKMVKRGSGDLGNGWRDWIIAHALLSEARGLIDGQPAASDPFSGGKG